MPREFDQFTITAEVIDRFKNRTSLNLPTEIGARFGGHSSNIIIILRAGEDYPRKCPVWSES